MSDSPVACEIDEGVATVTIDRPDARNTLSTAVADALCDAVDDAEGSGARCLVVEGAGDTFCAGGDLEAMLDCIEDDVPPQERVARVVQGANRAVARVHSCSLPTVAKVDGPAMGPGAGLAIACDVPLASPDARFGFGSRRIGLSIDTGVSYLLPRIVGLPTAKELVFTGELIDADRARSLGIVTRVFEDDSFDEGVANIVRTIADGPTVALGAAKRLLDQRHDSLSAAIDSEELAQAVAFATDDHREGALAFAQRNEPAFEGR